jgi:hypothetical protein
LAYEKPQSGLRAFTTGTSVRFFVGTFCPPLELLRNSFIAAVKTSQYNRYGMCNAPKIFPNLCQAATPLIE